MMNGETLENRARKPETGQTWYAEMWRRGGGGVNSEGGKARSKRRKGLFPPLFASSLFISWKRTLALPALAQALKVLISSSGLSASACTSAWVGGLEPAQTSRSLNAP